jgi:hypothetical protein
MYIEWKQYLTVGFDLKRIAQSRENLSAEYSMDLGSTLLFGDVLGSSCRFWNERRLNLFIVGWI